MDDQYFKEEISYLFEQGREFAKQHPQKARMLQLDDIRVREPNVERLLESFAFLTSRIRQRLDRDFNQIADGLLSLMWPGYINPVPSFALLEMRPSMASASEVKVVPKGTLFDSEPLEGDIQCRFRTCFDAVALPLSISDVTVDSTATGSVLRLSFLLSDLAKVRVLGGHSLHIQLVGEFSNSWPVFDLLMGKKGRANHVEKVVLTSYDSMKQDLGSRELGPDVISPVGLTKPEELLPSCRSALWGYSLLRDFFLYPEKYQAFRVNVLDELTVHTTARAFDVAIHINRPWPNSLRVSTEQFRINTVPVTNLFPHDANPVILNRLRHSYTVRGDIKSPEYYQVYSVDTVESIHTGSNRRTQYTPLYTSHSRRPGKLQEDRFFALERKRANWGGWETYISFVNLSKEQVDVGEEVVSLSITCTNGTLPNRLLPNQIKYPVEDMGDDIAFGNITHPTAYILPDIEKVSLWRWLSHAALNYGSIQSIAQLKSLLTLQDFSESEANRHKIAGIKDIRMDPIRTLYKGALIPGIAVTLTVREEHFNHRGEIQLFAQVMSRFLSIYSSINSYIQLLVKIEPSEHTIVIQPRIGDDVQL